MANPLIDAAKAQTHGTLKPNEVVCVETLGALRARKVVFYCPSEQKIPYRDIFSIVEQQVKSEGNQPITLAINIADTGDVNGLREAVRQHPNIVIKVIYKDAQTQEHYSLTLAASENQKKPEKVQVTFGSLTKKIGSLGEQNVDVIICPINENYDLEQSATAKAIVQVAERNLINGKTEVIDRVAKRPQQEESDRKQAEELVLHSHESHLRELTGPLPQIFTPKDSLIKFGDSHLETTVNPKHDWVTIGNITEIDLDVEPGDEILVPPDALKAIEILKELKSLSAETDDLPISLLEEFKQLIPDYQKLIKLFPSLKDRANFIYEIIHILYKDANNSKINEMYSEFQLHLQQILYPKQFVEYLDALEDLSNQLSKVTIAPLAFEILDSIKKLLHEQPRGETFFRTGEILDRRNKIMKEIEKSYEKIKGKQIISGIIIQESISDNDKLKKAKRADEIVKQLKRKKEPDKALIKELAQLFPNYYILKESFSVGLNDFLEMLDEALGFKVFKELEHFKKANAIFFRDTDFEIRFKQIKQDARQGKIYERALSKLEKQRLREGADKPPKRMQDYEGGLDYEVRRIEKREREAKERERERSDEANND